MLEFLSGHPTPIRDTFCIDRFKKPGPDEPTPSGPRPIVLKLILPWDHCVLLSSHFNLKHFGVKGILFLKICPLKLASSAKRILPLVKASLVLSLLMRVTQPFRVILFSNVLS